MALASMGNTLAFPQAWAQMRRLFGPRGYASRKDVLVAQDTDTVSGEEDFEEWLARRKDKRATRGSGEPNERAKTEGGDFGSRDKGGRTKNPIDRRTGRRNRRYACNSEYHYDPQCPQKESRNSVAPSPRKTSRKSNKPYPSLAMETPVDVGSPPKSAPVGPARSQKPSFSTTIDAGGHFSASQSESVVVLDTGATANLVCHKWLGNHNLFLERQGLEEAAPNPSNARFKFGDGRIGR